MFALHLGRVRDLTNVCASRVEDAAFGDGDGSERRLALPGLRGVHLHLQALLAPLHTDLHHARHLVCVRCAPGAPGETE
jgi:hypothetical protein